MRQTTLIAVLAVVVGWTPGTTQSVQRAVAYGVRVVVSVTDGGRPVTGLGPADFEVFDQGVRQQVASAGVVGRVALGVVIDASLSVRVADYDRALAAAEDLVGMVEPRDLAAVVAFSDRVLTVTLPTNDTEMLRQGVRRVGHLGAGVVPRSVVWDAVFGATALVEQELAQPFIVLFSDGMDNASWLTKDQVSDALGNRSVVVDFVSIPWDQGSYDYFEPGRQSPEDLPRSTGGSTHELGAHDLSRKLRARLDELRHAYVLTYSPRGVTMGDGWHELKVRLSGRRGVVRARGGYNSSVDSTAGRAAR